MKKRELIGKRVTLRVKEEPCKVVMEGTVPLVESVSGIIREITKMPGGMIGILEDDGGNKIAFDSELDVRAGRIEIELEEGGFIVLRGMG